MMQKLIVLSTGAYKAALDDILAMFSRETGFDARAVYDSATAVAARIEGGEDFDAVISTASLVAGLAARGLVAGARVAAGVNEVCLAYRAGSAPPDMTTPDRLRETLLAAASISLSDPQHGGGSSKYFMEIAASLSIVDALRAKFLFTPGGQGAVPVGAGMAELGVAQTSEIAAVAGAAAVPLLPGRPGSSVTYELGLSAAASPAAHRLAAFIGAPAAIAIRRTCGLERVGIQEQSSPL